MTDDWLTPRRARRRRRLRDVRAPRRSPARRPCSSSTSASSSSPTATPGSFDGYPDPAATLGEAILAGTPRPARGRVVVSHLGVGLADLVFGDAILRRAVDRGSGRCCRAESTGGRRDGPRRRRVTAGSAAAPAGRAGGIARATARAASSRRLAPASLLIVVVVVVAGRRHRRLVGALTLRGSPHDDGQPRDRRASSTRVRVTRDANGDRLDRGRHAPRPVPRPGLRPRPGADVADGGLAPHLGRAGCPSCSGRARSRRTSSSGRSAGGRRPSATSPRCRPRRGRPSTPMPEGVNDWIDDHAGAWRCRSS